MSNEGHSPVASAVGSAITCTCCKPTHNSLYNWSAAECMDRLAPTSPWHIDQGRSGQEALHHVMQYQTDAQLCGAALWTNKHSLFVHSWKAFIHFGWDCCSLEARHIMKVRMGDHFYLREKPHTAHSEWCIVFYTHSSHSGPFIVDLVQ